MIMVLETGKIIYATEVREESGKDESEIPLQAVILPSHATVEVTQGTLIKPEHFVIREMYFIQNGNFVSGIGHGVYPNPPDNNYFMYIPAGSTDWRNAPSQCPTPPDKDEDKVVLAGNFGGSPAIVDGYLTSYLTPYIEFTGQYKNLNIEFLAIGDTQYFGLYTDITSKNGEWSFSYKETINNRLDGSRWISGTKSLNVSDVRGNYYIALRSKAWINGEVMPVVGTGGQIRIKNLWLSG